MNKSIYQIFATIGRWIAISIIPAIAFILLGIAAYDAAYALATNPSRLGWGYLALALGFSLVYRMLNAATMALMVAALGHRLAVSVAIGVWVKSELLRWLPGGGIWGYLSRASLLTLAGVPTLISTAAVPLELLITLVGWITIGLGGAIIFGMVTVWSKMLGGTNSLLWIVISGTLVLLISIWWIWPHLIQRWKQLTKVQPNLLQLSNAYVIYLALNIFRGVGLYYVLLAVTTSAPPPIGIVISANAIAWVLGFIAIFAPGGLGIREGSIALLLSGWLPLQEGALVALVWRGIQIIEELLLLLAAWLVQLCAIDQVSATN